MAKSHDEIEKDIENKNELRTLEQFYVTNKVENLIDELEERKNIIVSDMLDFAQNHKVPCKWNRDGEPVAFKVETNPLVINNYFFKPVAPLGSIEPEYNAEKLSILFEYYCYLVAEVNDKIGNFPSSLTSFCKLAGITLSGLRKYKNSTDINMRTIVEKVYDQIGDTNITMSQLGMVNERSTIFKMKSQNEIVEKEQPKININIVEQPDMQQIANRLDKYKAFANKKG